LEKVKNMINILSPRTWRRHPEAGIIVAFNKRICSHKIYIGVCLGHQAVGEAFGGKTSTNLIQACFMVCTTPVKTVQQSTVNGQPRNLVHWLLAETFPAGHVIILDCEPKKIFPGELVIHSRGPKMVLSWLCTQ
jgi:GMP synthase-like glutamine amidotransferase